MLSISMCLCVRDSKGRRRCVLISVSGSKVTELTASELRAEVRCERRPDVLRSAGSLTSTAQRGHESSCLGEIYAF